MNTPLDQLELIEQILATRTSKEIMAKPTRIWIILGVENLLYLRKCDILIQVRKLYKKLTENRDFSKKEKTESLPDKAHVGQDRVQHPHVQGVELTKLVNPVMKRKNS